MRTELAGEVWHWSSLVAGVMQNHHQGYWTGYSGRDDNQELDFWLSTSATWQQSGRGERRRLFRIDDGDDTRSGNQSLLGPQTRRMGNWTTVGDDRSRPRTAVGHCSNPVGRPFVLSEFRLQRWVGSDEYDGSWRDLTPNISGHSGQQTFAFAPATARFVLIFLNVHHIHQHPGRKIPAI